MKNTDLLVFWSHDPDSTKGGYAAQESAIWRVWLKEMGKKMIFIDPFCNYYGRPNGRQVACPPARDGCGSG